MTGPWMTLAITLAVQAMVSMALLTLPVMAPVVASALGVSAALVGVYVALVYAGAMTASLAAGTPARQGPFSLPSAFVVSADASTAGTDAGTTFWSPRRGLSYRVQLAADAGFTRVLSDDWVSGSQVTLPAGAQDVYLRWQSRDVQGRTSRLSAVHRVTPNNTGLRTEENQPVKGGDNTIGTGNSPLQQPR